MCKSCGGCVYVVSLGRDGQTTPGRGSSNRHTSNKPQPRAGPNSRAWGRYRLSFGTTSVPPSSICKRKLSTNVEIYKSCCGCVHVVSLSERAARTALGGSSTQRVVPRYITLEGGRIAGWAPQNYNQLGLAIFTLQEQSLNF